MVRASISGRLGSGGIDGNDSMIHTYHELVFSAAGAGMKEISTIGVGKRQIFTHG